MHSSREQSICPPPAHETPSPLPQVPLEQRKPFWAKNKLAEPRKILSLPRGPPPPTLRDDSMAQTLWAVPHTGCVGPVVLRLKPPTSLANFASLRACLQQGWAPKLGARQSVWPGKELFWEFLWWNNIFSVNKWRAVKQGWSPPASGSRSPCGAVTEAALSSGESVPRAAEPQCPPRHFSWINQLWKLGTLLPPQALPRILWKQKPLVWSG